MNLVKYTRYVVSHIVEARFLLGEFIQSSLKVRRLQKQIGTIRNIVVRFIVNVFFFVVLTTDALCSIIGKTSVVIRASKQTFHHVKNKSTLISGLKDHGWLQRVHIFLLRV